VQPKVSGLFLLVAKATAVSPPIRELQEAAADALRPRYAFFLFPAFPLLRNPLRCIAPARGIVLVSLTASSDSDVMPPGELQSNFANDARSQKPWKYIYFLAVHTGFGRGRRRHRRRLPTTPATPKFTRTGRFHLDGILMYCVMGLLQPLFPVHDAEYP
jgi:hypothetical protein